jgi:hypothetical protein
MKTRATASDPIAIAVRHSFTTAVVLLALVVAGCGGGTGGSSAPAAVNSVPAQQTAAANSFTTTSDSYGMSKPTYLTASKTPQAIRLLAAVATKVTDQNFKTLYRIDVPVGLAAGVYSLGAATQANPAFPGAVYFFNGHASTQLATAGGTITIGSLGSNPGEKVSGSFNAVLEDSADTATPKASYSIAANFDFTLENPGPVLPAPVVDTLAAVAYNANCASCHALGSYDTTKTSAPDLALKGGKLNGLFTADQASHQRLSLTGGEIVALQVLLNSN